MSEQRDLPESMAWRVIGRLKSGQTQRSVSDTVGVARSVVARMWNRFKETGNVRRRPRQVGHVPLRQVMTGIYS
ncbi:hypothetical protein TNCV_4157031 [Trichonephila clavipes]|nr:hypothetical protein TNCV_4157031 [Trichonephila clavipes]